MSRYALLAEPDPPRAAGLLALVNGEGLEGLVARDGAEAQELVRHHGAPALVLTDLALPRVDGFELLSWLRVDLVGLGRLNATRGFDAGDTALKDVARRVEGLCAPSGFAVRWEGGTLLAALPGVDAAGSEAVRQQLHGTPGLPETVSAAVRVEGEEDPQDTLRRTQAALARAKRAPEGG